MKIVSIDVSNFLHFAETTISFIYPPNHPKAGQPLDKVCFIGQSGTGKTTLLNEISAFKAPTYKSGTEFNEPENEIESHLLGRIKLLANRKLDTSWTKTCFADKRLYFPTELLRNERHVFGGYNTQTKKHDLFENHSKPPNELKSQRLLTFREQDVIHVDSGIVWDCVFEEINHYDELLSAQGKLFVQKATNANIEAVLKELVEWKRKNLNPRKDLADNCLNRLLHFFQLEVDVDNTTVPIAVKSINGEAVPANALSTGTKQIILTALPLYKLQTPHSVVLFDEPERSLFPDLQQIIVDYYTSLAPSSQFFFATHSPFIAAAFEPYERFILYFDEAGKVRCKNGVAPIGDDPNDILKKDFELTNLMNNHGRAKYKTYLQLKTKIRKETNPQRKDELLAQLTQLGNDYNF